MSPTVRYGSSFIFKTSKGRVRYSSILSAHLPRDLVNLRSVIFKAIPHRDCLNKIKGLEANTKYKFKVVSCNKNENGKYVKGESSEAASVTTKNNFSRHGAKPCLYFGFFFIFLM